MTRRLLASYLALTLALLAALEIPLALSYQDRLEAEITASLQRDAFVIASYAEETVEGTGSADLQTYATNYSNDTAARVVIVAADGTALADSDPVRQNENFSTGREEITAALAGRMTAGTRHSDTLDNDIFYVAVPVASGGKVYGAVRITYSTDQIHDKVRMYWVNLAGVAVVSLLAATAIGVALARWVARPLREVQDAATGFGAGDLTVRAPTDAGPPEVRRLAASFNDTASRLQQTVTAREQFVADASHQLRTPLAALRLRLENVQQENAAQQGLLAEVGADTDFVGQDLDAALDETDRLTRIVDGLLALARADRTDVTGSAEPIYLAALLDERVAAWDELARERDVQVHAEVTDRRVLATRDRLTQVLDNLIANAVDVSPAGSAVWLRVTDEARTADGAAPGGAGLDPATPDGATPDGARPETLGGAPEPWIAVHVIDQGPGMTAEQRARAFDRLWRADTAGASHASPLGGSGLGLAIVHKLAQADGGEVELRAAPEGGLDAVVLLPRARAT